jgi:hypothetical protein
MAKVVNLIEKRIGKDRAADALDLTLLAQRVERGEVAAFCVVYIDTKKEAIVQLMPAEVTHDESLRLTRGLSLLIEYVLGFARTVEGKFI